MSLVNYEPLSSTDSTDYTPFVVGSALALTALLLGTIDNTSNNEIVDSTPVEKPKKERAPDFHILDDIIINILKKESAPMSAKDIVKKVDDIKKTDVNSRLYKMLSKRKIKKCDTYGAPILYL